MPNRIIEESLCTSERISSLTDFEFRLWIGLITFVDDRGRGDARAAVIKGRVFPLREKVTAKTIEDGLHGLASKGCVTLYEVGGKPYFCFPSWADHQRIRNVKEKYPPPEDSDILPQSAAICGESRRVAASCCESRPESESESELESESKEKDTKKEKGQFSPPTLAEVAEYVQKMEYSMDPEAFIDFYESKGWMVGKNKMKDWQASARNWERNHKGGGSNGTGANRGKYRYDTGKDWGVKSDL